MSFSDAFKNFFLKFFKKNLEESAANFYAAQIYSFFDSFGDDNLALVCLLKDEGVLTERMQTMFSKHFSKIRQEMNEQKRRKNFFIKTKNPPPKRLELEFERSNGDNENNDDVSCAICLRELLSAEDEQNFIFCGDKLHGSHADCLAQWMAMSNKTTCPFCTLELNKSVNSFNDMKKLKKLADSKIVDTLAKDWFEILTGDNEMLSSDVDDAVLDRIYEYRKREEHLTQLPMANTEETKQMFKTELREHFAKIQKLRSAPIENLKDAYNYFDRYSKATIFHLLKSMVHHQRLLSGTTENFYKASKIGDFTPDDFEKFVFKSLNLSPACFDRKSVLTADEQRKPLLDSPDNLSRIKTFEYLENTSLKINLILKKLEAPAFDLNDRKKLLEEGAYMLEKMEGLLQHFTLSHHIPSFPFWKSYKVVTGIEEDEETEVLPTDTILIYLKQTANSKIAASHNLLFKFFKDLRTIVNRMLKCWHFLHWERLNIARTLNVFLINSELTKNILPRDYNRLYHVKIETEGIFDLPDFDETLVKIAELKKESQVLISLSLNRFEFGQYYRQRERKIRSMNMIYFSKLVVIFLLYIFLSYLNIIFWRTS